VVLELMSIASGLEMRRRKRQQKPVLLPSAVLVCAVALSISAQVVEAERSVIGWIATAVPALGFLIMVKIALARASSGAILGMDRRETSSMPAPHVRDQVDPSPAAMVAAPSTVNGHRTVPQVCPRSGTR
jgi:hypothetical protein